MSDRFNVSVISLDFGREVEIRVVDNYNPTRTMKLRVAETQIDDVEEMLQAILDLLAANRKRKGLEPEKRLLDAFQEGVSGARGEDDQPT